MGSSISSLDFLDPPSREGELGMLGHYRVIDQLGKGGMGYVFRAEDTRLQRSVALKVMNRKIAATPNSRARFISEARAMAAVHHDNVATIFEVGEHNKTPYMAMEMLQGSTLERFKGNAQRPSFQQIIQFAKEIARGLAAAHAQGIVHRDIKPANMWIESGTDRIKILDFGLALASTPVDQLSGRGAVIGTPGYLSPEQARSEPLDDRSDLYSVGVVLYELATDKLPLNSKSVAGQLIAILSKPPRPLREWNSEIPQPLANLIHKLLNKEPRDRVASAVELEKELDRVEVECESKSEVAQALNKLQAGLNQIVSQKDEPDFSSALDEVDLPDPFAALPDGLPELSAPPGGASVASPSIAGATAAGSSVAGGRQSRLSAAVANPYQKQLRAKNASKSPAQSSGLQKHWPVIAVAAVVMLILVPAAIFMINAGQKRSNVTVTSMPDDLNPVASASPRTTAERKRPTANQNSNNSAKNQRNSKNRNTPVAGRKQDPPTSVAARSIIDAMAPGAIALIDANKGNGSFEDLGSNVQSVTGSGQAKKTIPGWTAVIKGKQSGWSAQDGRGASDGKVYAFVSKKSSLDLTSDLINHTTQTGDVFRVVFDVGSVPGEGKWIGKTKYNVLLGFRGNGADPSRWKLGEVQDQTNIDQKKRVIGFEYVAQAIDQGKKPFLKISMAESNDRRATSFLDHVRLTVASASSHLADQSPNMRATIDTPSTVAMNTSQSSSTPPLASAMAASVPPQDLSPTTQMERVTIRTSDPNGADATVKKGGSRRDTLGSKPTLALQMRGDIPVQHIYLKFNLDKVTPEKKGNKKNTQRKTGRVALILRATGKKSPANGKISVYGAGNENAQVWTESGNSAIYWKNSYSEAGLASLPLLAELTIPEDQAAGSMLTITSPELADFIRQAPGKLTTLVLEGRSDSNLPLAFVSREGNDKQAPALIIEVAP